MLERLLDKLIKLTEFVDPESSKTTNIRVHGVVLFVIGIAVSVILNYVTLWLATIWPSPADTGDSHGGIQPFCCTGLLSFFTLSLAGFGAVELVTGSSWKESRGCGPLLILIVVWACFYYLLFTTWP